MPPQQTPSINRRSGYSSDEAIIAAGIEIDTVTVIVTEIATGIDI
jgi:hypothetical protein